MLVISISAEQSNPAILKKRSRLKSFFFFLCENRDSASEKRP